MTEKYFTKAPPFINRIQEKEYIKSYLAGVPTSILFVYGPKSTGKTTLINKAIEELDQKQYAVQYINMRGVLIKNFADFKNIFFPENIKGKIKEIVSGIKINVGFFGWDIDDEKMIATNIFEVMETKLRKANEKGIKPVMVNYRINLGQKIIDYLKKIIIIL